MFDSTMLDVAIGLVFVYMQLSLISAAIKEGFEAILFNKRARELENGIKDLLEASPTVAPPAAAGAPGAVGLPAHPGGAPDIVAQLLNHPLISIMKQGGGKPSYIPAKTFALALMDLIKPANANQTSGAAGATEKPSGGVVLFPTSSLQSLRQSINDTPLLNENAKRALRALLDAAGNDIVKVRENIETWFNNAMDAVTTKYKKWSQKWIFVFGLALTLALNADSIAIISSLSQDKTVREKLVDSAEQYAKEKRSEDDKKKAELEKSTADLKKKAEQEKDEKKKAELEKSIADAKKKADEEKKPTTEEYFRHAKEGLAHVGALGLPIGWSKNDPRTWPGSPCEFKEHWQGWLMKIIGWIVTAFAVSLGAPFWFDLLSKFINIRASMKTQAHSTQPPAAQS